VRPGEQGPVVELRPSGPGLGGQPSAPFRPDTAALSQALLDGGIQGYGRALFQTLLPGTLDAAFTHALETARAHNPPAPLHVRLMLSPELPDLHLLQWEYLFDADAARGVSFLAGDAATPFSRLLPHGPRPPDPLATSTQTPLSVLFVIADPTDLGDRSARDRLYRLPRLDVATELKVIDDAVAAMKGQLARHGLSLRHDVLASGGQPVTLKAIHDRLAQGYHVLHLVAHGLSEGGVHRLVLEDSQRRAAPCDEASFAAEIDPDDQVRLVFLGACLSGRQSEADAYRGLAARLVLGNVPAVVAMMHKVSFETVHEFTQVFYSHLAYHGVVDRAMNAARRAMYAGEKWNEVRDSRDWAIPLLFNRTRDGRLFATGRPAETLDRPDLEPQRLGFRPAAAADTQRVVGDLVSELGERLRQQLSLSLAQQSAVEQRLLQIAATPPAQEQAGQVRPSVLAGAPARRDALLAAVQRYRGSPWRAPLLLLRAHGRETALDNLRRPGWLGAQTWTDLLTRAEAQYAGQVYATVGAADALGAAEALGALAPRDLRADLRRSPAPLAVTGNLTSTVAAAPAWQPALAAEVADLLDGPGAPEERLARQQSGPNPLPLPVATGLLHLAAPEACLPFDPDEAARVQQWLGHPGLPARPAYDDLTRLARDLLADEDLGLVDLPDAVLFLQHAARWAQDGTVPAPAQAAEGAASFGVRERLALDPARIDSVLELPPDTFPSLAAALNAGKHAILIGPPGTGKTTLAEDLARHAFDQGYTRGFVSVTATADWTTFDTIGGYMPTPSGELVFRPGVFLRAIRENKWLIIDEINRADIDKAFGELFTVLSGQGVALPYERGGRPIRILPPGQVPQSDNDYVLHRGWRILGTMNVYDKASLFAMSNAFMRRFAFVDVDVPEHELYGRLIDAFLARQGLPARFPALAARVKVLFDTRDAQAWPLMHSRALGPAIAVDVVRFLAMRRPQLTAGNDDDDYQALAEAFNLYAAPQLDGLDEITITAVYASLPACFGPTARVLEFVRKRIRGLFPHVREWPAA
jgi:MoxR-like ATPase